MCLSMTISQFHKKFTMIRDLAPDNIQVQLTSKNQIVDVLIFESLHYEITDGDGVESLVKPFILEDNGYLAPEILGGQSRSSMYVDVWSLGAILFKFNMKFMELLTFLRASTGKRKKMAGKKFPGWDLFRCPT